MNKPKVRRTSRELSESEQEQLVKHRAEIAGELPDMIARNQTRKEARDEKTLSGEFRRAIHGSKLPLSAISEQVGIPLIMLD